MRRLRLIILAVVVVIYLTSGIRIAVAGIEEENKSASAAAGLFWSTAKEEGDLSNEAADVDESSSFSSSSFVLDEQDNDYDGGFSSLDGMLQWAIGHSDPTKLKETAQDAQHLTSSELQQRQMELKELMERLRTPSDAQLMQIAIDDLNNLSLSLDAHQRALQELLVLVEPIDNANDLHKLGGLAVVVDKLNHPNIEIRTTSAWILGKASQNNPIVQKQVLELRALEKLMEMIRSSFIEEAIKAFYAISALIRNNVDGQELFYAEGGAAMLQNILSNSSADIRLRRKSIFLVADLVQSQLESRYGAEPAFLTNRFFLKSVVDLIASDDLDLQEKALYALKNLLQLRSIEAMVLKEFCGLDAALERMRDQLHQLMTQKNHKEYAVDIESLRREVEQSFSGKMDKVGTFEGTSRTA